jgi:2'-phosphotransferase
MRNTAEIIIHIDLEKALAAGIPFFLSANGVVLTAGNATGFLAPEYFSRVETRDGKALPGWEGKRDELSVIDSDKAVDPVTARAAETTLGDLARSSDPAPQPL